VGVGWFDSPPARWPGRGDGLLGGVIDWLATDLRRSFPEMTELSPRNLKSMCAFAAAWPEEPVVQQRVARIPWGHHVRLLDYAKSRFEREWSINEDNRDVQQAAVQILQGT
jgi:hypothetical protein